MLDAESDGSALLAPNAGRNGRRMPVGGYLYPSVRDYCPWSIKRGERLDDTTACRRIRKSTRRATLLPVLMTVAVLFGAAATVVRDAGAVTVPGVVTASTVHFVPASIDRTGRTDVTAAIVAFIKSVPDGSTVVFPVNAQYRIESIVLVTTGTTSSSTARARRSSRRPTAAWSRRSDRTRCVSTGRAIAPSG